MEQTKAKGPGAAATAHRAEVAVFGKPTHPFSANSPVNTAGKQASELRSLPVRRRSLRTAIDAMCKSCIYDPGSGNGAWREQVEACASSNCPLHTVRPVSRSKRLEGDPAASLRSSGDVLRVEGWQNGLPAITVDPMQGGAR